MKKHLLLVIGLVAMAGFGLVNTASAQVAFDRVGTFQANGGWDEGATEIIAYDSASKKLFSTNGALTRLDVIDMSDPANPMAVDSLRLDSLPDGTMTGGVNSVATYGGLVVAAVENDDKQAPGYAVFFDSDGNYITKITCGALPDMVTFNKDGSQVIVANEGEPNADYSVDPEGSITIIDIPADINDLDQEDAWQLSFHAFDQYKYELMDDGVRLFGGVAPIEVVDFWANNGDDADTLIVDLESIEILPDFTFVGAYEAGTFDEGATEIIAYDAANQQVFSTNGELNRIDVIDISDVEEPVLVDSMNLDTIGGGIQSVAVHGDVVVAAVAGFSSQDLGWAVFFKTDGTYIGKIQTGALPDMVTFTPDGKYVLTANEGEPNADYSIDPEGSVTIIELPTDIMTLSQGDAVQASFNPWDSFKADLIDAGLRIFGGVEAQGVTGWMANNGDDVDSVFIDDATNFAAGMRITLDSDNGDDDVDWVRSYVIGEVVGDTLILSTEFDFEFDGLNFEEGTDTSADASAWTVYLNDGSATLSEDLEPEYIAVNATSDTAFVTLQENNGVAVVDIKGGLIYDILPLGTKDHMMPGNGLDASNRDDAINIKNHPLNGMYMPDAIASFESNGMTYYVTANEGDAREYDALIEEEGLRNVVVDPTEFPNTDFQSSSEAGRINVTTLTGDIDMDGDIDEIYSYGARSFTVWDAAGNLIWDSGDDFEQITAMLYPAEFNSTNDETDFDDRSDNKGPEPEAITTGMWMGNMYAFIGLERMGGIMVYNIDDPMNPEYVDYINTRNYDVDPALSFGLAPEDIKFVPASDSPSEEALLIVSNEVSGTVEIIEITNRNELWSGDWLTLDSDNSENDVDWVRTYQIEEAWADTIVLTTALDYSYDGLVFEEGTDTSVSVDNWTLYLLNQSSTVSQDLEPEYISVSPDNDIALVTLQENNAVAVVDLENYVIDNVLALGTKDHNVAGNGLDASDKDDDINITTYPIVGMYMPDAISSFKANDQVYFVTANEGDAREYDALIEEFGMGDVPLDPTAYPNAAALQDDAALGRLKTSIFSGDSDWDGDFDTLHAYGSRSFSVWADGELVWDSGDEFEQIIALEFPEFFNTTNDASKFDNRSDNKGPEPEAITVGVFNDTNYIFVALERMGGIMVYEASDPMNPEFVTYLNNRDYDADDELQGDQAPEDIVFVPADMNGVAHLYVSNEVSGTVSIYTMQADLGVGVDELATTQLVCYPTPASNQINVEVPVEGAYELNLLSINGTLLKSMDVNGKTNTLNLTGVQPGMYFVEARTAEGNFQQKIMVK